MTIQAALEECRDVLGEDHVTTEQTELSDCEETTFASRTRVHALLRPASAQEISRVFAIAEKFSLSLHVISRGRNCGYGSKAPYQDAVLLDLSRMNAITAYDEELAYVRVQAGVTQRQLADFLRERGDRLMMDPIATFDDCSVLANILERGHGLTGAADRIASGTDYEAVLPNGEILSTGYSGFAEARARHLDRWAPGPSLEGLFSQSNMGVVTEMTVWLMPKPESARLLVFGLDSHEKLAASLERLRRSKLDRTIQFGPRFFNEIRMIQTFARYPWEKMNGVTPLSENCILDLRESMRIPLWTGAVGFYGNHRQISANCELAKARLYELVPEMMEVEGAREIDSTAPIVERFAHALFRGMTGNVERVTERPRWRKRSPASHPDWSKDRCGIIWFPVTVPFRGADVMEAVDEIRACVFAHGFEPDMSVSAIRDRTLEINCSIVFDRDNERDEANAPPCARETLARLAKRGFHSHRLGLPTMDAYDRLARSNRRLIAGIKNLTDPKGILSRGRYS